MKDVKSFLIKNAFSIINLILLLFLIYNLRSVNQKVDEIKFETEMNILKLDYLESDINKRNMRD